MSTENKKQNGAGGEGEFKVTVERNMPGNGAGPSFVPHCAMPGCPACAQQPQPQFYSPQPPMHNHPPPPVIPIPVPMHPPAAQHKTKKKSWHGVDKPHPLLWLTFAISILAVVLGVPKGTLPTITGRHRALRELLVQERLTLLTQLSAFLPPPLASLFAVPDAAVAGASPAQLDMLRLGAGLQLWHTQGRRDGPWWTLEELGSGATVVHSRTSDRDREVWVLRSGDDSLQDQALLAALTNSLLARERLHAELENARKPCPPCPAITLAAPDAKPNAAGESSADKWAHLEERSRALRDRAAELDDREHDVVRREMWVVDAMRKLSDKSHATATELALEDRVVERLKTYQRQAKEQA